MTAIKAIGQQSVHQICSGQVILDLATAVKELLENSVDAGATSIDIKLKDYGRTSIEVSDNGQGVEESNLEGLTLKHHTSKLQDFTDLATVETFGFRGEALSSLCALCLLCITTRHKTAKVAHRLEYDNNGKIIKKTNTARQPGTTVILKDIFYTLPVRRKEFEKNLKREYAKLLSLLNAYCMISTGVRISCSNETGKGNRSVLISTSGTGTIFDTISSIFGSKQCTSLLQFKQVQPTIEICEMYLIKHEEVQQFCERCKISGYISSCGPGLGRNSNDRQFYSINKRPCDMQKVAKVVNEVFHMFNRYQYPFVQLDISTNRQEVDVNVTPDKRKIFMQREKFIFAIIKTSLLDMYNGKNHAIGFTKSSDGPEIKVSTLVRYLEKNEKEQSGSDVIFNNSSTKNKTHQLESKLASTQEFEKDTKLSFSQFYRNSTSAFSSVSASKNNGKRRSTSNEDANHSMKHRRIDTIFTSSLSRSEELESVSVNENPVIFVDAEKCDSNFSIDKLDTENRILENLTEDKLAALDEVVTDVPSKDFEKPIHITPYSFDAMKGNLLIKKTYYTENIQKCIAIDNKISTVMFKAKIATDENKQAEAELSKFFSKSSFENMKILGQFNMGFIIAQHQNDIFIIDQHAADEKYNFETLQKTTTLIGQPLIIPQKLELTAGERIVMLDNVDIFLKNGFNFKIEKCENAQDIVYLTKVPSSQNWTFEASDVSEMIFMLTDAPRMLCRPSRVRQMFASRACRKSVMIGTSLTEKEMKKLVTHMSEMDQPWNCPHGRPTMRHLADLSMIAKHGKS